MYHENTRVREIMHLPGILTLEMCIRDRISAAEGAKFSATMNEFVATIHNLGENKKLEDLRCKE